MHHRICRATRYNLTHRVRGSECYNNFKAVKYDILGNVYFYTPCEISLKAFTSVNHKVYTPTLLFCNGNNGT